MRGEGNDFELRKPMEWNNVNSQLNDKNSILNHYRRLLKIRNTYKPLNSGNTTHIANHFNNNWDHYHSETPILSIKRSFNDETVLIIHLFNNREKHIHLNLESIKSGTKVTPIMGLYAGLFLFLLKRK
jgi:glycosidase